ncbi:LysR substrate-binding domain-containing protein [Colwelliaceae bacterium 6441]
MDKLSCMNIFCRVVKEGGFSAAARKLDISKVMVSRSVSRLEQELGVRLLQRTTRKMSLTNDGKAYFERCHVLLDELMSLDSAIKDNDQNIKGTLRLAVPSEAFTQQHLLPFLSRFSLVYPQLAVEIDMSDRLVDIVEEGIDVAVRIGELEDSSLIAKKLADTQLTLCASTDYAEKMTEQNSVITHPSDIEKHPFVLDSNYRNKQQIQFTKANESIIVEANRCITVNSAVATCHFIEQNLGIGIVPDFMMKGENRSTLVRLLPDWQLGGGGVYAVYSSRKHLSAKVKCFIQALSEYFQHDYRQ